MTTVVIPAAGRGSRLGTTTPKALVELHGRPLLSYVLEAVEPSADAVVVVIGPEMEHLFVEVIERTAWKGPLRFAVQDRPSGSATAIEKGIIGLAEAEPVIVVWADQVGVGRRTVSRVADTLANDAPGLVLPLVEVESPYVWYSAEGSRVSVGRRRDGDPSPPRGHTDVGTFGFRAGQARPFLALPPVGGPNGTREHDFVYVVPKIALRHGLRVVQVLDPSETLAVNDVGDLDRARLHLEGAPR